MVTIQSMIKYLIQLMFLLCCEKSWNLTPTKKVVHILQNELVSASNLVNYHSNIFWDQVFDELYLWS